MSVPAERRQHAPRASKYADVQVELTQIVFRNLASTIVVSSLGLVGTTAMLAMHYRAPFLWRLAAVMLLICVIRTGIVLAFNASVRSADLTCGSARRWQYLYALGSLLYCASLATSSLYNFGFHDGVGEHVCTLGTFMICAGLSARMGMPPWINQGCGFLMLTALAYSILHSREPLGGANVLLICAFSYAHYESVRIKFDILVEQLRARRALRELSEQDVLTGLANRRYFQERLESVPLSETVVAVLYLDLDRFKRVNDTHGHKAGDLLLQKVAERLRSAVRKTDLLARLGGDEFAVLHGPGATEQSAESLARRINELIAEPFDLEGEQVEIGASVGVRLSNLVEKDPQRLLNKADEALYRVKHSARGSFCMTRD